MDKSKLDLLNISKALKEMLLQAEEIIIPKSKEHLIELSLGGAGNDFYTVGYDGIDEATVTKCKNGLSINFVDS